MLKENVEKKIENIIDEVKNSIEYKKCIEIKNKMKENRELIELIEDIKKLQKRYIITNDINIKEDLENKQKTLDNIPIYCEYNNYIQKVNEKIEFIKDFINEYFDKKINDNII